MRTIYKLIACSLLALFATSCVEDVLEKEQYQKEIYLIGAYDRVWTTTVDYSDEEVRTYFTVSSSGSLELDQDVKVKVNINDELVDTYNRKYWTVLNEDKYYKSLDTDLYSIPSIDNIVIKHEEGISAEVPIFIQTKDLSIDRSYVIPVEIESTTAYPVNESGRKMLILLKLRNAYSGNYQMDGYMTEAGGSPRRIQKAKELVPTGINKVRIFYAMNNKSDEQDEINAKTLELTILDENVAGSDDTKKVSIKAWDEGSLTVIDSGESSYNTVSRKFNLKYTVGNISYEEGLLREKVME